VVVVGGGIAGAAAALELIDQCPGVEVVVLEGHARLGGRVWSFRRRGHTFDNGQHVFLRCCTEYLSFLDRIGARDLVELPPRLDLAVLAPGGRAARLRRDDLPAPLHLGRALLRYGHISLLDRARLGPAVVALRRLDLDDPALDSVTFGQWLARHGQSAAAIAKLWDLIVRPTVNVGADDASLTLAAKVVRTGLLDSADGVDIGWARVPLSVIHDGAVGRALEVAGVEVRTRAKVETLEVDGAGRGSVRGVRLVTGEVVAADAVVLAVPHPVAARLAAGTLPVAVTECWSGLGTSPIVNVHLVLDRMVSDLPMAAAVDSPVQFVFDRSDAAGVATGRQCLVSSLSAAEDLVAAPADRLIAEQFEALGELFPAARHANVLDAVVTRERSATFAGGPGSRQVRPAAATSIKGLALAGAWTDTGWPSTMEGAVRSGRAAADSLLPGLAGLARGGVGDAGAGASGDRSGSATSGARQPADLTQEVSA
jgi:squalene-associated FAD-dependent desaturase